MILPIRGFYTWVCSCEVGFGKEMVICILVVQQLNPTDNFLLEEK